MFNITLRNATGTGVLQVQLDRTPDKCPICHVAITPVDWTSGFVRGNQPALERLLQCPNATCQRLFIARYNAVGQGQYSLVSSVPTEIRAVTQTETITAISPDFCGIFDEAHKAEQLGLKLVAGPGYRKALEFLVKDYILSQSTEGDNEKKAAHKAAVEKMLLGACIETYVKSEQIKKIAKRAAWLGNDETHYVRKWEGKDLEDLKKLISLTLHWIEIEKLTADVIKDMPEAKAKSAD
jgi:hypothetical protein